MEVPSVLKNSSFRKLSSSQKKVMDGMRTGYCRVYQSWSQQYCVLPADLYQKRLARWRMFDALHASPQDSLAYCRTMTRTKMDVHHRWRSIVDGSCWWKRCLAASKNLLARLSWVLSSQMDSSCFLFYSWVRLGLDHSLRCCSAYALFHRKFLDWLSMRLR